MQKVGGVHGTINRRTSSQAVLLRLIESMCLVLLAFGASFAGIYSGSSVTQVFLVVALTVGAGGFLLQLLVQKGVPRRLFYFACVALASCTVYIVTAAAAGSGFRSIVEPDFVKLIARLVVGPVVFIFCASRNWDRPATKWTLCILAAVWLSALILLHKRNGFITGNVVGSLHSNMFGFLGFVAFVYGVSYVAKSRKFVPAFVVMPIGVIAVLASKSRGTLASLIVFLSVAILVRMLRVRRGVVLICFIGFVSALAVGTFVFPDFIQSRTATTLDNISRQVTGKELDTGRGKMWRKAVDQVKLHPLIGSGVDARDDWDIKLANGSRITLSVHSYYLAVLRECGLCGLVCIVCLVGGAMLAGMGATNSSFVGSIFAVMFHQASEVSLTTGTFTLGITIWAMWGFLASVNQEGSTDGSEEQ